MTPRERLHRLIDELPEEETGRAERVLRALAPTRPLDDLGAIPLDDEPADDPAALAEARAQAARGEGVTTEELRRGLGLA